MNLSYLSSKTAVRSLLAVALALVAAAVVALVVVNTDSNHHPAGAAKPYAVDGTAAQPKAAPASPAATATPAATPSSTPSASSAPNMQPAGKTSSVAPSARAKTASEPAAKTQTRAITYTVKRGDNLTVIAAWFKLHGYGDLYKRNMKVIGADPDLIFPGQTITVSSAGASLGKH